MDDELAKCESEVWVEVLLCFEKRLETGKELKGQSLPLHADFSNVLLF